MGSSVKTRSKHNLLLSLLLTSIASSSSGLVLAFAPSLHCPRWNRRPLLQRVANSDVEENVDLGVVRSVAEFRDVINSQPALSTEDRIQLIEQAQVLVGDLYTHFPLKRAMHAIDPLQRLRLLRQQYVIDTSITEFHQELLEIFKELRDLHTNYSLPGAFGNHIAFLGVLIEQYFEEADSGKPKYMISKVASQVVSDDVNLKQGVEVTHWNGMPIDIAVARNGDKEAGSNLAARMARGLENLTLRFMSASFPPDEDWVTITYIGDDGQPHESRLDWQVFEIGQGVPGSADHVTMLREMLAPPLRYQVGMDDRAERFRRAKKLLFNQEAVMEEKRAADCKGKVPEMTALLQQANAIPTSRPDEISARIVETDSGKFGYLRLWSFFMQDGDIASFIYEVIRLVQEEMPMEGLILDVRGNGGGYVIASEILLQLFTPKEITPEPSQFIATAGTLDLAKAVPDFQPWLPSLAQAVSTGAPYSAGIPLSPKELVNVFGQIYYGPVVLLTDAYCYSACDMFAAGFQDHGIGQVLGVDDATGAGGANVLTHEALQEDWTDGPLEPLPGGAGMRVAIRRTLRVGDRSGQVLEDLGVKPDQRHYMTAADLLEGNTDLINRAAEILKDDKPPRNLEVSFDKSWENAMLKVNVKTMGDIDTIDIFVNDRPVSNGVEMEEDEVKTIPICPIPEDDDVIRVDGWSGEEEELVVRSKFTGPFQNDSTA